MKEAVELTLNILECEFENGGEPCPCCGSETKAFLILHGERLIAIGCSCDTCLFAGTFMVDVQ